MATSIFKGQGIQTTGSGNLHVSGNVNIGGCNHDQRDAEFLKTLRVTDPRDDKTRIERQKGGLLENSYQWVLDHPDFQKWSQSAESQLLWIKGDPGKGKTMLLCGIINEIEKASQKDECLSYFFCQAADMRLNAATSVVRGLLYVLLAEEPELITQVREKYDQAGAQLFQDVNQWDAICKMLKNILLLPNRRPIVLVIDGLDECVHNRHELLELLVDISTYSRVKFLVSGRNWQEIEEVLTPDSPTVWLSLELNHEAISPAVQMYIRHVTDQLARKKKYSKQTSDLVLDHLLSNSDDTYLWVALVIQELDKPRVRSRHVEEVLRLLPRGLISIYERILENIQSTLDAEYCRQVLAIASVVYRPLTLRELAVLLQSFEELENGTDDLEDIVKSCDSLLSIRNGEISFVHQSAKEFLLGKAMNEILPLGVINQHRTIFSSSLRILSDTLRRDMYQVYRPGTLAHDIKVPDPDPLAAVGYCAVYWIDHFSDSLSPGHEWAQENEQDMNEICSFLEKRYLYWLEAASLLHKIPEAVMKIQKLELIAKSANAQGVKELVEDARRFLLFFKHGIRIAPLQVYTSALIFSPSNSLIRRLFSAEEPTWVQTRTRMAKEWDGCIHTLEGHLDRVTSAAISPDQRQIATTSYDGTIKLWDPDIGDCAKTIEGKRGALFGATFFPDGRRLATFSEQQSIEVWDLNKGACIQVLYGHAATPTSIALLAEGRYLLSGSHDKTIKLWDLGTGDCHSTFEEHAGPVLSVVGLPGTRQFVTGSNTNMINMWDAGTGKHIQTLRSGFGPNTTLTCTSDGRWVFSASDIDFIRGWELGTKTRKAWKHGHTHMVSSIAISPDNKRLASSSFDKTVKVWDIATGGCLHTLRGHAGRVNSVQFFADGARLLSSSDDSTAKIWDLSRAESKNSGEFRGFVSTMAISARHGISASGAKNGTIKIWENASGRCIRVIPGHEAAVALLSFLPDGNTLLSHCYDCTARVWDLTTGQSLWTFKTSLGWGLGVAVHPNGRAVAFGSASNTVQIQNLQAESPVQKLVTKAEPFSLAFAGNSRWIACGLKDSTIEIWSLDSSRKEETLQGHTRIVESLSFSADAKWLASGGGDGEIRIWHTETWNCVHILELKMPFIFLEFDPVINSRLHTQLGVVNVDRLPVGDQQTGYVTAKVHAYSGFGLSLDRAWILKDGIRLLWLPPKYRSLQTVIRDSTVVVGCGTGDLLILEFLELD